MKSNIETIELNGVKYVKESDILKISPVESNHIIVIAQRGWIFEGYKDITVTDKIRLNNASVVRSWSNGKGIGGLCKKQNKLDYTLDFVGTVEFANEGIIATLNIEW